MQLSCRGGVAPDPFLQLSRPTGKSMYVDGVVGIFVDGFIGCGEGVTTGQYIMESDVHEESCRVA